MKTKLIITVLASWVNLIWCGQIPERPAYNFGETYRVYGDTKECIVGSSGTKCRSYQTQYFQMLPNRTLRIDTNVKNFHESFLYFPSNNGFFRYHYIPSNWKAPCTVKEVPRMPIQRVPLSFNFNGTDTVEWKTCNLWRRDTGYNPVTTETWCIHYNNDVYPSTTEPLSFTVKQMNLTRKTLWRGYTTSVAKWYFNLPYQCPSLPSPTEDSTENGSDNSHNESNNVGSTEGNNMEGLTTKEPMKTAMTIKMTVTTKMPNATTTAGETRTEADDEYENDNNGHSPTSTPTSMMNKMMSKVTMPISDNYGDPDENDNNLSKYATTAPKRMTTKMTTVTMATRPTTAGKAKTGTEDEYENENSGDGPTSTPTSMTNGKMRTEKMEKSDNDEVPYENGNKGKNTTTPPKTMASKTAMTPEPKTATMEVTELATKTKANGYDDHSKEKTQTISATTATILKTTTLPPISTTEINNNAEDEDENENNNNTLFSNS